MTVLDNPVWHALRGPQSSFAEWSGNGAAVRFDPEVTVFAAVEQYDERGWDGIRQLVRDAFCVLITTGEPSPPADARATFQEPLVQMVAPEAMQQAPLPSGLEVTTLGPDDHDELAALVDLTKPGPWRPRTPELGDYSGVREGDGTLVAVCGQRLRPPGAIEISAVATHPDHVRRGLAAALTTAMANRIAGEGHVPFLHVMATNEPARALYRKLGFVERRELTIFAVRFE